MLGADSRNHIFIRCMGGIIQEMHSADDTIYTFYTDMSGPTVC